MREWKKRRPRRYGGQTSAPIGTRPQIVDYSFLISCPFTMVYDSAYPPGTMFVEFFRKKYLPAMDKHIMVIPARLIVRM